MASTSVCIQIRRSTPVPVFTVVFPHAPNFSGSVTKCRRRRPGPSPPLGDAAAAPALAVRCSHIQESSKTAQPFTSSAILLTKSHHFQRSPPPAECNKSPPLSHDEPSAPCRACPCPQHDPSRHLNAHGCLLTTCCGASAGQAQLRRLGGAGGRSKALDGRRRLRPSGSAGQPRYR